MEESVEIIRSRQNRTVALAEKLNDRKARESCRSFRFDGCKLLEEAVRSRVELCAVLLRESGREALLERLYAACGWDALRGVGRVLTVADGLFERISEEKSPDGVICIAKYIDKFQKTVTIYNDADFREPDERIVLLESVRDPLNVGAVIRSAAALGVDRLILSGDCADVYHPRAVRASMGALFCQRIDRTASLPGAVSCLRRCGRRVFAAALDPGALRLGSFRTRPGDCVVIGNEGHGLSREVLQACGQSVYIPITPRAESLNAAVAAGILMWEFSSRV